MLDHVDASPAVGAGDATLRSPSQPAILIVDDNLRYRTQMQRMVGKSCPQAMIYEAENIQLDSIVNEASDQADEGWRQAVMQSEQYAL